MVPYLVKIHYFQNETICFYSGALPLMTTIVRKYVDFNLNRNLTAHFQVTYLKSP